MKPYILSFCILFSSFSVYSQEKDKPIDVKFLVDMGISFGGDELLEVMFTNGNSQTMDAGQGGYIAMGGQLQFTSLENLLLRADVGVKYVTTAAENANIRFTRVPIHLGASWVLPKEFRIGAGITTHQRAKFKGDGFVPNTTFSSSVGPRFELAWKWIALTYEMLDYTDPQDNSFSANSVGCSIIFTFPNRKN